MAFRAVLDACVLYPASIRDTLLRLAEYELYDPVWSAEILDEMQRNLVEDLRATDETAARLRAALESSFDEAMVATAAIKMIEPSMTNDPKDRHVLAAAVAGRAEVVVTSNLRDFPEDACAPLSIEARPPDDFLCSLFEFNPPSVISALQEQAADLRNPTMTFEELLEVLENAGAGEFVAAVRADVRTRSL